MTTLLLRLAGPLQAWGDHSRFSRRLTRPEPSKSGILGMLAAADGMRRTDSVEDLISLRFGVRTEQPGRILRDFQTAIHPETGKSMPLSERFYIADGVFLAGIEGPLPVIERLAEAVQSPKFPLYLGRRSCVPSSPVFDSILDNTVDNVLETAPWKASGWFQERFKGKAYDCALSLDQMPEAEGNTNVSQERVRDVPISWDPRRREYEWREVIHTTVRVQGPPMRDVHTTRHDPWEALQ